MTNKIQRFQVLISESRESKVATGEIRVQSWSVQERLKRAAKYGGIWWGAAIVTVFIPGLHFILVPACLIAGPIVAFRTFSQEKAVLGGEGTCPYCRAQLPIVQSAYQFPISDLCVQCQSSVKIELAHSSEGV